MARIPPPAPDLPKPRIARDTPAPGVRRALGRNLIRAVVALALVVATVLVVQRRAIPTVQTLVVTATSQAGVGDGGGTSVTANGYVVARTRASVSAKVPGRLAFLGVSEGSFVRQGDVIARLENADYQAQVTQAEANVASARADLLEAEADRDNPAREARPPPHLRPPRRGGPGPRRAGRADRGPPARDGAGESEHSGPRSADSARDGGARGFHRAGHARARRRDCRGRRGRRPPPPSAPR